MHRRVAAVLVGTSLLAALATAWAPVEPRSRLPVQAVLHRANGDVDRRCGPAWTPWLDREWTWRAGLDSSRHPPEEPGAGWTQSPPEVRWRHLVLELAVLVALGGLLAMALHLRAVRAAARDDPWRARAAAKSRWRRLAWLAGAVLVAGGLVVAVRRPAVVDAWVLPMELPRDNNGWRHVVIDLRDRPSPADLELVERALRRVEPPPGTLTVRLEVEAHVTVGRVASALARVERASDSVPWVDPFPHGSFAALALPPGATAPIPPVVPCIDAATRLRVQAAVCIELLLASDGRVWADASSDGRLSPLDAAALSGLLAERARPLSDGSWQGLSGLCVVLRADRATLWGTVLHVLDACARIGIWRVYLAVEPATPR